MKKIALLLAVAGVAAAGSVAFGAGMFRASDDPFRHPATRAAHVLPQLKTDMAAFRGPATALDRRVRKSSAVRASSRAIPFGANAALARAGATLASGDVVALVPTRDGLCLGTARIGITGCSGLATVLGAASIGSIICARGMEKDALIVYGAVPDSVGGASVTRADGSAVNARLVRNSFVLETTKHASRPVAVRLSIGDAAITRDALVPADASRSECEGEGRRR